MGAVRGSSRKWMRLENERAGEDMKKTMLVGWSVKKKKFLNKWERKWFKGGGKRIIKKRRLIERGGKSRMERVDGGVGKWNKIVKLEMGGRVGEWVADNGNSLNCMVRVTWISFGGRYLRRQMKKKGEIIMKFRSDAERVDERGD